MNKNWNSIVGNKIWLIPWSVRPLFLFIFCYPSMIFSEADTAIQKSTEKKIILPIDKIVSFQHRRHEQSINIYSEKNQGIVRLTNLNQGINRWFILTIMWPNTKEITSYHIENSQNKAQNLFLIQDKGLVIRSKESEFICQLWDKKSGYPIKVAKVRSKPFAPLCDNRIYLRNKISGYRTTKEWVVDFLRTNVWGGESITTFVKENIYQDRFFVDPHLTESTINNSEGEKETFQLDETPMEALIGHQYKSNLIDMTELGIMLANRSIKQLTPGQWYQSRGQSGVFISAITPKLIHPSILDSHTKTVKPLDEVEKTALTFLVAFDIDQFEVGYALGTDHPKVHWSDRVLEQYRRADWGGPDGFDTIDPIVSTGLINPDQALRIVATFTGGFKRSHGGFRWGKLATVNFGSHYGFIENGLIFSQPILDLATFGIQNNGDVIFKTWETSDIELLPSIVFLRQNGVPIVDFDAKLGKSHPGKLVGNWSAGNWSGSQDRKFRTLRAGICLQESGSKKYLIYAYFSSATPSAMARIFQSYQCLYAMHLDMNALEHTYLALYVPNSSDQNLVPQQLVKGMKVLDTRFKGNVPRFIGYPDNRDFFYLLRKKNKEIAR